MLVVDAVHCDAEACKSNAIVKRGDSGYTVDRRFPSHSGPACRTL